MKRGDVLFFSGLGHVDIYVGRGRMVHGLTPAVEYRSSASVVTAAGWSVFGASIADATPVRFKTC